MSLTGMKAPSSTRFPGGQKPHVMRGLVALRLAKILSQLTYSSSDELSNDSCHSLTSYASIRISSDLTVPSPPSPNHGIDNGSSL